MSRIAEIATGRFDYPMEASFKFIRRDPDGIARRPTVLIRLTDEDGVVGWGQAVPSPAWSDETPESVEATLVNYLAPVLVGANPADLAGVHNQMNTVIRPAIGIGQPLAKSGIDLACHDLAGKQAGKSVSDLLGGPLRTDLKLSWTINVSTLEDAESQVAEGLVRGYSDFNIKVGPPQSRTFDVELASLVRRLAPAGFLWADANGGYELDDVLAIAPKFAGAGVDVLESPLPAEEFRGYQALKRQGALPVLMDEGIVTPRLLAEFIALDMLDGAVLKPARNAGLWPSLEILRLLREYGLIVLGSGLTEPDLALAGSLHLFAIAGINAPCALNGPQYLGDSLSGVLPPHPETARLSVPTGPGLGLTLDHRAMQCLHTVVDHRGIRPI